jgi:hypothetical protein
LKLTNGFSHFLFIFFFPFLYFYLFLILKLVTCQMWHVTDSLIGVESRMDFNFSPHFFFFFFFLFPRFFFSSPLLFSHPTLASCHSVQNDMKPFFSLLPFILFGERERPYLCSKGKSKKSKKADDAHIQPTGYLLENVQI